MNGGHAISIVRRLIESSQNGLRPTVAEAVLQLDFPDSDHTRMSELAEKSDLGTLTAAEAEEYDGYIEAADLLALWQSRARLCLSRHPAQV